VVAYRTARANDADEIAALWALANRARGAYFSETSVGVVRERIGAAAAIGKIAEEEARVVGVAILSPARENGGRGEPIPGLAHLNTVSVNPERWGMGIGRALVALIVEHARQVGYDELQLYVDENNERARRLYERDGWKPTGEATPFEDAVLLRYVRVT